MSEDQISSLNKALEGRYAVESRLGEGGMATVYLADDLKHNRKVALKVLKPELAAVVGAERFLAEIETTANLQHPHILPLFDSGEAETFLYYVMPYIEDESLGDRLARERQLPVDEAVKIATDLAEALDYAHRRGVIHRDIKPANIMMHEGRPLIADFGIALAVGAAGGARLTETGLSVGTPFYMSPEQATGDQNVGPQSDTYALGCVLYEMLVGEPPYPGATAQAVLGKIIAGGPVSATEHRPMIPANVDAAIRRCLEKLPADRFHSAKELAEALGNPAFRHGATMGAAAGSATAAASRYAMAGWGVAAILGIGLVWTLLRPEPPEPVTRVSVMLPADQSFHPVRGDLDLSDDGTLMVYRRQSETGPPTLWMRSWDALAAVPIRDTEFANLPAISPDGTEVAFTTNQGVVQVVPLLGGVSRTLTEDAFCCPAWSPDGAWVYYTDADAGISRVSSSGGPTEVVTRVEAGDGSQYGVEVLPGGRNVLYQVLSPVSARIQAVDVETGTVKDLTPGRWPRYSPTGHLLFVEEGRGTLLAAPFDPDEVEITGPAFPIADGLMLGANDVEFYDISDAGRLVYRTGNNSGLVDPVWVDRNGATTEIAPGWGIPGDEDSASLALSPDGSRLALSTTGPEETLDIYIKQLDDGPLSRLTFEGSSNRRPAWLPDGESIVFISNRAGQEDIWTKRADGSDAARLLVDGEGPISEVVVARDGSRLVYVQGVGGNSNDSDIYTVPLDGSSEPTPVLATEFGETEISLSPDGRWLAYVSNVSGDWEVWVRPFPNVQAGRWQVSTLRGDEPVWSNDGTELFYRTGFPGERIVATVRTEPSFAVIRQESLFPLTNFLGPNGHEQYSVSPDNQRFVMLRLGEEDTEFILVENWVEDLRERERD